jgi:hypothetical protein
MFQFLFSKYAELTIVLQWHISVFLGATPNFLSAAGKGKQKDVHE